MYSSSQSLRGGGVDWQKDGLVLTAEQKLFYEKNGYLLVRNFVSQHAVDMLNRRFKKMCESERSMHPEMMILQDHNTSKFHQCEHTITKLQDFQNDPVLFNYCKNSSIMGAVQDLVGTPTSNLVALLTMFLNKPPDTGSLSTRHPLHQDLIYFPIRPADSITCAWTALQKSDRSNGCLTVIPGSHKGELLYHELPEWEADISKANWGLQNCDPSVPRTYIEMEAGDTVFFHPLLINGSGANRTGNCCKSITCHYANGDRCHYVDVMGTPQEELARQIVKLHNERLVKRMGMNREAVNSQHTTYADVWKHRARAVNGNRANL